MRYGYMDAGNVRQEFDVVEGKTRILQEELGFGTVLCFIPEFFVLVFDKGNLGLFDGDGLNIRLKALDAKLPETVVLLPEGKFYSMVSFEVAEAMIKAWDDRGKSQIIETVPEKTGPQPNFEIPFDSDIAAMEREDAAWDKLEADLEKAKEDLHHEKLLTRQQTIELKHLKNKVAMLYKVVEAFTSEREDL